MSAQKYKKYLKTTEGLHKQQRIIEQMQNKKGHYYNKWKAGMKRTARRL